MGRPVRSDVRREHARSLDFARDDKFIVIAVPLRNQIATFTKWSQQILRELRGHHRLGEVGRFRHHLVGLGNAYDFFDSGLGLGNSAPAIVA